VRAVAAVPLAGGAVLGARRLGRRGAALAAGRQRLGEAVQVDPIKPKLKPPGTKCVETKV